MGGVRPGERVETEVDHDTLPKPAPTYIVQVDQASVVSMVTLLHDDSSLVDDRQLRMECYELMDERAKDCSECQALSIKHTHVRHEDRLDGLFGLCPTAPSHFPEFGRAQLKRRKIAMK